MPLVLTQNEATESGHAYADVLGESYEYPTRYRNRIREGERFVYYRGRRTAAGGVQPQVYLGTGRIGPISPAPDDRLRCEILEFAPFPRPLFFKAGDSYLETGAEGRGPQAGLYFQQGVREVTQEVFRSITDAAGVDDDHEAIDPVSRRARYADAGTNAAVDAAAIRVAKTWLAEDRPGAEIEEMPHNNPGYDLLVRLAGEELYVEVKGTSQPEPVFFLTEYERTFAERNKRSWTLVCVYGIEVETGDGTVLAIDDPSRMSLKPHQWIGRLDPG